MNGFGKLLIGAGLILLIAGGIILIAQRFGFPLGRLPGDLSYQGKNVRFYFPLGTSLLISLLLSLILWFINRGR